MMLCGGVLNNGMLNNGMLKSQTRYNPYALYLDFPGYGMVDKVSGKSLTTNIAAGNRYDLVNGVQTLFTEDEPCITENGLRGVGAYTNLIPWSEDFNNWTVRGTTNLTGSKADPFGGTDATEVSAFGGIGNDFYYTESASLALVGGSKHSPSIWVKKISQTGSLDISSARGNQFGDWSINFSTMSNDWELITESHSSVTVETPFSSELDGGWGVLLKASSSLSFYVFGAQVVPTPYPLPYIPTAGAVGTSVDESGAADYGVWLDDVSTNFLLVNTALTSKGTLTLSWTPGYSAADITGEQGLISFDGTTSNLRYDADNDLLELTDGTNVASVACTPVAGTAYVIKAVWEGIEMRLWVDSTAGTMGVFTGTFSPGTDINLNVSNELNYLDDIKLFKEPDWTTP